MILSFIWVIMNHYEPFFSYFGKPDNLFHEQMTWHSYMVSENRKVDNSRRCFTYSLSLIIAYVDREINNFNFRNEIGSQ